MQGKMEGKRKREKAEDEMVGLYHQLNGHEFEQNLGDSGGTKSLSLKISTCTSKLRSVISSCEMRFLRVIVWIILPLVLGLPQWLRKESACNARDVGSISGSGRSPGGGNGNPLQCSCLGIPKDRGAWWAIQSMELKRV